MFRDLIGIPYKPHGRNKEEGFDCYGLVIECAKRLGKKLNDAFENVSVEKLNVRKIDKPEIYCLIAIKVFGKINHIGMYLGQGMIIHCSFLGVCVERIDDFEIGGYYRITEE